MKTREQRRTRAERAHRTLGVQLRRWHRLMRGEVRIRWVFTPTPEYITSIKSTADLLRRLLSAEYDLMGGTISANELAADALDRYYYNARLTDRPAGS